MAETSAGTRRFEWDIWLRWVGASLATWGMVGALFLWALMGGSAARAAELGDEGILENLLALNLERAGAVSPPKVE